ncbi:hypothetical protein ACLB2K_026277 [Fragaria x ananassa]
MPISGMPLSSFFLLRPIPLISGVHSNFQLCTRKINEMSVVAAEKRIPDPMTITPADRVVTREDALIFNPQKGEVTGVIRWLGSGSGSSPAKLPADKIELRVLMKYLRVMAGGIGHEPLWLFSW